MKKGLLLLLFCLLLPAAALARPYQNDMVPNYALLSRSVQTVVDLVYDAASDHLEEVDLPKGTSFDDANMAVQFVSQEYPELPALSNAWRVVYYQNEPDVAVKITLSYTMSLAMERDLVGMMTVRTNKILSGASGSTWDRELYLHDTLCAITEYNDSGAYRYEAVGPLIEGAGVCEGYSKAFAFLCRLAGIPCSQQAGTSRGATHSWNVVVIDGTPALVDPTWDDQLWGTAHFYFNNTDEQLAPTHQVDGEIPSPACSDPRYEYSRRKNLLAGDEQELLRLIPVATETMRNGSIAEIYLDNEALFSDLITNLPEWLSRQDDPYYGAFSYSLCEDRLAICLFTVPEY